LIRQNVRTNELLSRSTRVIRTRKSPQNARVHQSIIELAESSTWVQQENFVIVTAARNQRFAPGIAMFVNERASIVSFVRRAAAVSTCATGDTGWR
jgi:hypothetical protein